MICCPVTKKLQKLLHQLLSKSKAAAKTATQLLNSWMDFKTLKKVKRSKLNFQCIELLPSNQAATKAAVTLATSV